MTLKEFATRIALLHPAFVTLGLLAGLIIWPLAWISPDPLIRALGGMPYVGFLCAWSWSVFLASAGPGDRTALWAQATYIAPPLIIFVAVTAGWSMNNSPAAFAFFGALFFALWLSASAVEKAVAGSARAGVWRVIATTLLMYLAIVGAWVLRERIRRAVAIRDEV